MAWVGLDLDGTLAVYPPGNESIGRPVPEMVDLVKRFLSHGIEVRIMTARVSTRNGLLRNSEQTAQIREWCLEHIGQMLAVTCEKDCEMLALFDDRAVRVGHNAGKLVGAVVSEHCTIYSEGAYG